MRACVRTRIRGRCFAVHILRHLDGGGGELEVRGLSFRAKHPGFESQPGQSGCRTPLSSLASSRLGSHICKREVVIVSKSLGSCKD